MTDVCHQQSSRELAIDRCLSAATPLNYISGGIAYRLDICFFFLRVGLIILRRILQLAMAPQNNSKSE